MPAWLAEKMVRDYGDEPYITNALREAHDRVLFNMSADEDIIRDAPMWFDNPPGETDTDSSRKGKPGRKKKNRACVSARRSMIRKTRGIITMMKMLTQVKK